MSDITETNGTWENDSTVREDHWEVNIKVEI